MLAFTFGFSRQTVIMIHLIDEYNASIQKRRSVEI